MTSTMFNRNLSTDTVDPLKSFAQWRTEAESFRRAWMGLMGMTESEIDYHCEQDPPTDLDAEVAEYNAILRIKDAKAR